MNNITVELRFCFCIAAEVGLAEDDAGNPASALAQAKLSVALDDFPDIHELLQKARRDVANMLDTGIDNVTPISVEEYDTVEESEPEC